MKQSIFNIKCVISIVLILCAVRVTAQYDIAYFQSIKDEYPEENIIKLTKKVKLTVELNNNNLDVYMERKERVLYLKNSKGFEPEHSTYTSQFDELIDFEANTYYLEKDKYKKLPVKKYDEVKKFGDGVFFDDYTELVFTFPGVAEGSVIELNTKHKIHEPRFIGIIFMNEYLPVHDFEMIVECDKNVDMDFVWQHVPENYKTLAETVKGNKKIYSLHTQKLNNIKMDEFQPDRRYYSPHIIPIIKSYSVNNNKVALLESTKDLYNWYYSFIKDVDKDVDYAEINEIVRQNISDDMSETEKVEALYFWVQKNIKYIAFEDGMGGFIPRKPDEVLKKLYGDCKDKTSILRALLKEAGIKSYFTWIGSRDIPYKYSELPSPLVDNHMILTYKNGETYYFLDGTGSYQQLDIPTSFIQGKEALISIDKNNYEVRTVPIVSTNKNEIADSVYMTLKDNKISGNGEFIITGLPKIRLQYSVDIDDKKDQKEILESILEKGSNKFILKDYSLPIDGRFADSYEIPYQFELDDYVRIIGDELYLNLNLNTYWLDFKLKKDKETPLELNSTLTLDDTYIFKVPNGYKVEYLPEKLDFSSKDYSYHLHYKVSDKNEIIYYHNVAVNKLFFEKHEFKGWNQFISDLEKAYKQTVLISKENDI